LGGATGRLTYVGNTPTEAQPRGFAIDPAGKYLVASGESSQTLSVHSIDGATGSLRFLDRYPTGKGSNWVEIVVAGLHAPFTCNAFNCNSVSLLLH
jgi:6-phosphogluconolactonase